MATSTEIKAALGILDAVAQTIREVGSAPAGTVYAALMAHGCSLAQFEQIIGILCRARIITRSGDMLTWTADSVAA